jgi:hypothetical protein
VDGPKTHSATPVRSNNDPMLENAEDEETSPHTNAPWDSSCWNHRLTFENEYRVTENRKTEIARI